MDGSAAYCTYTNLPAVSTVLPVQVHVHERDAIVQLEQLRKSMG